MVKNNLTKKQVNLILTILFFTLSILLFLIVLVKGDIKNFTNFFILLGLSMAISGMITFLVYIILDNGWKDMQERYNKTKIELLILFKELNTFYEVELTVSSSDRPIDSKTAMFLEIVKNEGCKFYAELLEDESIHIICKDYDGKIIYDKNIENYFYFNANFKFVTQNSQ